MELQERIKDLYTDIFDFGIIDLLDFNELCIDINNKNIFDKFEDMIHMCIDTMNLELLSEVLSYEE